MQTIINLKCDHGSKQDLKGRTLVLNSQALETNRLISYVMYMQSYFGDNLPISWF